MKTIEFKTTVTVNDSDNKRLDAYLAVNLPDLTRNAIQKLLESGSITLNGKPVKKNHKTSYGDEYTIIQNEPDDSVLLKQDIPLDVVYEDIDLIVVNKPKGMVVHPAPGHSDGTLVNALLHHCGDSLSGIGGIARPGIVHRIDKDTSGLVIAAKNDHAHQSLASQLASRTLTREYETIVCGNIKNDIGTVDAPIGRHPVDRKRQAVQNTSGVTQKKYIAATGYRDAITHYEVISRYPGYTYIRCRLETGRTHQIRVHMAHTGHPILGDIIYGRKKPELGMSSQCLHAKKLCFKHPTAGESIELCTELPDYFINVLSTLEKREGIRNYK